MFWPPCFWLRGRLRCKFWWQWVVNKNTYLSSIEVPLLSKVVFVFNESLPSNGNHLPSKTSQYITSQLHKEVNKKVQWWIKNIKERQMTNYIFCMGPEFSTLQPTIKYSLNALLLGDHFCILNLGEALWKLREGFECV